MSHNAPSPPPEKEEGEEEEPSPPQDLSASGLTIPSDSEAFSSLSPPSTSPPQSSSNTNNNNNNNNNSHEQKVVVYSRPTFWGLVRGAAINLLLPFVNGMMLGLGELLAHELAFRWGWGTTQVSELPLLGMLLENTDGHTTNWGC
jgi:Outer membrane protein TOM13